MHRADSDTYTQCDFLVNSVLHTATTMADLCRIHRQLIFNICTDSRTFTRIFNKTRVNYKIFFILMQKLESTSFHIKIWHLVELFLIFWHCFLFVYLQIKKAGNFKFYYQNWFIFWKISLKKHNNKQILLYILYRNTIWPSGTIARVFVSQENHSMCMEALFFIFFLGFNYFMVL